jgi:RNA polymerase sigma-70 factor (ECF subfamily)
MNVAGEDAGPLTKLQLVHERGQQAWPGTSLPFRDFADYLQGLGLAGDASCEHGIDLYLACACLAGDAEAIGHFERRVLVLARPVVARLRPVDDFVDEVLQEMRARLLVGTPKGLTRYAGRGPLSAWVRVAATRAAIDALRAAGARPVPRDIPEAALGQELDPEVRLLLDSHREAFQQALAETLGRLPAADRNLLRRHLVDGMTLEEMAAPYGVHPATIARRLAAAREDIALAVRQRLLDQLGEIGSRWDAF